MYNFFQNSYEMEFNMPNLSSDRTAGDLPINPPSSGTRTGRVWEIADAITLEKGRRAQRHEVVERYVAENGNRNTAGTEYQRWKSHRDKQLAASGPTSPGTLRTIESQSLKVAPDGRVLIPREIREAMALGDEDRVTARVEAGELRLVSPAVAVRQIQSRMKKYKRPGESVVDRFLSERRAMWGEV